MQELMWTLYNKVDFILITKEHAMNKENIQKILASNPVARPSYFPPPTLDPP